MQFFKMFVFCLAVCGTVFGAAVPGFILTISLFRWASIGCPACASSRLLFFEILLTIVITGTDMAEKEGDMVSNRVLVDFTGLRFPWVWGRFPYPWALTNPDMEPGNNPPRSDKIRLFDF